MLLSKANLLSVKLAAGAKEDPDLYQMHIEDDGTTVATDGKALIAVEPVHGHPESLPRLDEECGVPGGGVGIDPAVVEQALKQLPKGKLALELGYAIITRCHGNHGGEGGARTCELTTTDLKQRLKVEGSLSRRRFPEWKNVLRSAKRQKSVRVAVDRKSLRDMLDMIDAACPDPDNSVFLEIPVDQGGIIARAASVVTGQRVVGFLMPLETGGEWLPNSDWEKKLFVKPAKRKKKRLSSGKRFGSAGKKKRRRR